MDEIASADKAFQQLINQFPVDVEGAFKLVFLPVPLFFADQILESDFQILDLQRLLGGRYGPRKHRDSLNVYDILECLCVPRGLFLLLLDHFFSTDHLRNCDRLDFLNTVDTRVPPLRLPLLPDFYTLHVNLFFIPINQRNFQSFLTIETLLFDILTESYTLLGAFGLR